MLQRLVYRLLSTAALVTICCLAAPAGAQWSSDTTKNTLVCNAANIQDNPKACTDEADGAIIVWEDLRSGADFDIYAQRLDASGHALWGANGLKLCTNAFDQKFPIVASDGSGGAYVVWQDHRTIANSIDLYAQHVTSGGTLAYGISGIAIAAAAQDQNNARITSDGVGNAWVVWEDNRAASTSTRPDIYMNKLTSGGASFGTGGMVVTNQLSAQHRPAICDDGSGGVYVAWENNITVPTSIYVNRYSSTGSAMWNTTFGVYLYKGDNSAKNVRNLNIRRDGSQLMMAWEETSVNASDGQNVLAMRLRNDSTKVWYSPAEVTGDYYGDQTLPQIFSDDSAGTGVTAGCLVVFQDNETNAPPYYYENDVAMVRILPDGGTRIPSFSNGFFYLGHQANGQVNFKCVKVDQGSLLSVFDDARNNASDTDIYAQRVDKWGTRYFPTTGSPNYWGQAISASQNYQSRQVTLAPRTNGGIAAWTDGRNGNSDIYAQLIFKDGSLPVELTQFTLISPQAGQVDVLWKTTHEHDNAGFEIQKRRIDVASDNSWTVVSNYVGASELRGSGNSETEKSYAFVDRNASAGVFEYRLIDIALDGARTPHDPKSIEVRNDGTTFNLAQNVPNPFASHTELSLTLPTDAIVDVVVSDVTGRTIAQPLAQRLLGAGSHAVELDSHMITSSGSYFVSVTATDPNSGAVLWHSAKPVMIERSK